MLLDSYYNTAYYVNIPLDKYDSYKVIKKMDFSPSSVAVCAWAASRWPVFFILRQTVEQTVPPHIDVKMIRLVNMLLSLE